MGNGAKSRRPRRKAEKPAVKAKPPEERGDSPDKEDALAGLEKYAYEKSFKPEQSDE